MDIQYTMEDIILGMNWGFLGQLTKSYKKLTPIPNSLKREERYFSFSYTIKVFLHHCQIQAQYAFFLKDK